MTKKVIWVSQNPKNETIEIQAAGSKNKYEVTQVYRLENDGNRVEVTLKDDKRLELEFPNIFRTFQFLQQLRVYLHKSIQERRALM